MKTKLFLLSALWLLLSCSNDVDNITNNDVDVIESSTNDDDNDYDDEIVYEECIAIHFSEDEVAITNPFIDSDISITNNGGHVTVQSNISDNISYILSGNTSDGSFKLYGNYKYTLIFNNVEITNPNGAAINNQCSKKLTVVLNEGTINKLTDGITYNYTSGEDMKATLFSEGQINVYGNGSLEIAGKNKHAICIDDYLHIHSGNINITEAASDAIHVNEYIKIDGGVIKTSSIGEGLDCEEGYIEINGGEISITTTGVKAHGLKSYSYITIDENVVIDNNNNEENEDNEENNNNEGPEVDPDEPTGIFYPKTQNAVFDTQMLSTINSSFCSINIEVKGNASKGLKSGSDINIINGNIQISTSGNAFYDSADADISSCAGIKCDGNLVIDGGTINITSSGTGGKGINVDGLLTMNDGDVTIKTTGGQYTYSSNSSSAKGIKCDKNIVINDGNIAITTKGKGAEGLESKAQLYINGGSIEIEAYDDCINASKHIEFTGGDVYCYSSNNDGIDSNGTITITGGRIITSGTNTPEEGFDCDQNKFTITGGYILGLGGATSTPTSSACTQYCLIYSLSSALQTIHIESSSGVEVLTFKAPRTYNQTTLLFSCPELQKNTTYSIYTGGSISGGTDYHGWYTDANYTKGTSTAATFTTSSIVTTVGSSSGGGPGGGPGGGRW